MPFAEYQYIYIYFLIKLLVSESDDKIITSGEKTEIGYMYVYLKNYRFTKCTTNITFLNNIYKMSKLGEKTRNLDF